MLCCVDSPAFFLLILIKSSSFVFCSQTSALNKISYMLSEWKVPTDGSHFIFFINCGPEFGFCLLLLREAALADSLCYRLPLSGSIAIYTDVNYGDYSDANETPYC